MLLPLTVGMDLDAAAGCGPEWPGHEDMARQIRGHGPLARLNDLSSAAVRAVGLVVGADGAKQIWHTKLICAGAGGPAISCF